MKDRISRKSFNIDNGNKGRDSIDAMDLWQRARNLAEEAAKRSQELSIGGSKLSDIVSETARKSKEMAVEASKRAAQMKTEAVRRADKFKTIAEGIAPVSTLSLGQQASSSDLEVDLKRFGITEELKEFVKEITPSTFQNFPFEDDSELSDVPTVSNVQQDLTEWQERHANLVLSTVKEISKLRYELCPRVMKERKFWRTYFILVNSHVAVYENKYMEETKEAKEVEAKGTCEVGTSSEPEVKERNQLRKTSSVSEQDLDVFLLGDLEDGDEGPEDDDVGLDDDFDKMVGSSEDDT